MKILSIILFYPFTFNNKLSIIVVIIYCILNHFGNDFPVFKYVLPPRDFFIVACSKITCACIQAGMGLCVRTLTFYDLVMNLLHQMCTLLTVQRFLS